MIRGNNVSMAPTLIGVIYETGTICGAMTTPAGFSGNQFIGNVFRNPVQFNVEVSRMSVNMSGAVGGNLVQSNDFGSNDGPNLIPLSGFIDGGGNICGPFNPAVSNFACTGGGSQSNGLSIPSNARLFLPPPVRVPGRFARALNGER